MPKWIEDNPTVNCLHESNVVVGTISPSRSRAHTLITILAPMLRALRLELFEGGVRTGTEHSSNQVLVVLGFANVPFDRHQQDSQLR